MARLTPIDYQMQVMNPMAAALEGYQAGFGQMQQLDEVRRQREADAMNRELQEMQMAQLRSKQEEAQAAQRLQADFYTGLSDGTMTIAGAREFLANPLISESLASTINAYVSDESDDQIRGRMQDTAYLTMLERSDPDLFNAEMDRRVEAAFNANNQEQVDFLRNIRQLSDLDPSAAQSLGMQMVSGFASKLGDEGKLFQEAFLEGLPLGEPEAPQTMLAKARQDLERGFIDQQEFDDLAAKLTAVPDTGVSVVVGGASEAEIERAKVVQRALVGNYETVSGIGQTAQRNMPRLNQLASIIEDVTPGASARARVAIRNATGISIGEDMDDLQVFDALINQLVPQQRPPGSGTMSDADLALFKNSLPSLIGTKEGNRAIIETMIAINEYDIEAGKIARRALIDPNYTDEMAFAAQDALYERMNPLGTFENAVGDSDLFGGF